jgi:muconolactone delta-isomerase
MDAAGVKDATITELRAENERLWRAVRAYRVNSIHESIDSMQELDEALDALAPIQEKP